MMPLTTVDRCSIVRVEERAREFRQVARLIFNKEAVAKASTRTAMEG